MKANMFGKAVTVVQFVTAIAALFSQGYVDFLALAAGALGVVAGATYWARVLRRVGRAALTTLLNVQEPLRTPSSNPRASDDDA